MAPYGTMDRVTAAPDGISATPRPLAPAGELTTGPAGAATSPEFSTGG
ncbi:hypothetical protein [Streptomyces specialis]|nr:hypothetical protein [Streptomyces specialis]